MVSCHRLLPRPPKLRHRFFAGRSGAVRHARCCRHDRGDGPEPAQLRQRGGRVFVDAPDHLAVGEDVVVLVLPLAGRAGGAGAFEDQSSWRRLRGGLRLHELGSHVRLNSFDRVVDDLHRF
jgi:hypothetical protein